MEKRHLILKYYLIKNRCRAVNAITNYKENEAGEWQKKLFIFYQLV